VANVPSRLLTYDLKNVEELREGALKLVDEGEKQLSLAKAAGDWDGSDFSKWLHHNSKPLDEWRYIPLLQHVANRGGIEPEKYDEVFVGISNFLGFPADETLDRSADFVGNYVIYRYSLLAPGYVLQGRLAIELDHKRKALRTTELFRIQSDLLTRIKNQPTTSKLAEERSRVRNLDFPRTGYFFPRSPDSYLMISKKIKKRDNDPVEIQTIYFENIYESSKEPTLMQGFLSDWHGKRSYMTRVVAQKLELPLDDKLIGTLDPADVNDIVNEHLTTPIDVRKHVASCS
jgi:hypothetical protein